MSPASATHGVDAGKPAQCSIGNYVFLKPVEAILTSASRLERPAIETAALMAESPGTKFAAQLGPGEKDGVTLQGRSKGGASACSNEDSRNMLHLTAAKRALPLVPRPQILAAGSADTSMVARVQYELHLVS